MADLLIKCWVIDDDAVSRSIIEHFVKDTPELELAFSFSSAIEAIQSPEVRNCDLLFLDIEMPEMSGLEFLEVMDDGPAVILVTLKPEYAVEAFDIDVVDYLLKPVTYGRFLKSVQRAKAVLASSIQPAKNSDHVFIKSEGKLVKLSFSDVEWIEAQRDYVLIHTSNDEYFIHSTMKRLTQRLDSDVFVRIHRSFIVRLDKVSDIQDSSVVIGRKVIPVGASYKDELASKINLL